MTPVFADEVSTQAQNSEQAAVQTTQTKTQTKNLVQEKEKDLKTNPLKSFFSKFLNNLIIVFSFQILLYLFSYFKEYS